MNLERFKLIIRNPSFIPVAIFLVMDIIMLGFAIYLGMTVFGAYDKVQSAQIELEAQKGTATLIQSNQASLTTSIIEYNEVLNKLIPDEETYFSVIGAFEQLSEETGVTINSYTINLDQTTDQKLSLELSISGDQESILRMLRDYNYASGRFLTNEEVDFTVGNTSAISFGVNLVHAKTEVSQVDTSITISPKDIQFMEEILQKMK